MPIQAIGLWENFMTVVISSEDGIIWCGWKEDQYGSESTSGKMVRGIPGRTGTVTGAAERRAGVRDAVRTWRRYLYI